MKYFIGVLALLCSIIGNTADTDKQRCLVTDDGSKVVITVEKCSNVILALHPSALPENLYRAFGVSVKTGEVEEGCWDGPVDVSDGSRWIGIAWEHYPIAFFPWDEFKSCITL